MSEEKKEKYIIKVVNPDKKIKELVYGAGQENDIDVAYIESDKDKTKEPKLIIQGPCGNVTLSSDQLTEKGIEDGISGISCTVVVPKNNKEQVNEKPSPPEPVPEVPPVPKAEPVEKDNDSN